MKGIEANLDKIKVILQMQLPQNRKEIIKLTSQIAALNRFIAKLPILHRAKGLCKNSLGSRTIESFR
jgi:hypothetical protein